MGRDLKTLESKKLVLGWKTQFWTLTASPGFEPQLSLLTSCVPSSALSPVGCALHPDMENIGFQLE